MKYGIRGGFVAVVLASLLFWSGCEEARAFVDPPVLVPEHPQALQPVYVRLRWGGCDGLDLPTPENIFIEPTGPQSIRVRISGEHYDGGPWCLFGPGTTADYPIGSFPSGTYQVEVQHIYDTIIGDEIATLGVLELQVAPADLPNIVPATGNDMLWALALLVILTAGVNRPEFRRHSQAA